MCERQNVNNKFAHRQTTRLWLTMDRPSLSSERVPQRDRTTNSRPKLLKRKQYLVKRPQSGLDTKTYWLTVSRKATLTLTLRRWSWRMSRDFMKEPRWSRQVWQNLLVKAVAQERWFGRRRKLYVWRNVVAFVCRDWVESSQGCREFGWGSNDTHPK
jgi:hypothetical protein